MFNLIVIDWKLLWQFSTIILPKKFNKIDLVLLKLNENWSFALPTILSKVFFADPPLYKIYLRVSF